MNAISRHGHLIDHGSTTAPPSARTASDNPIPAIRPEAIRPIGHRLRLVPASASLLTSHATSKAQAG